MKKFRRPLRFTLCLLPVALAAGWFAAQYALELVGEALIEETIRQVGSREAVLAITAAQIVIYTAVCGFLGYIISEKIGLMRPFCFEKAKTIRVILTSAVCGAVLSLDAWTFAKWIPGLGESYASAGSFDAPTWISSILYGGIIEEVMLRLFVMSLLALIGWKLFFRKERVSADNAMTDSPEKTVSAGSANAIPAVQENAAPAVPAGMLATANLIAALLFAAGHLPVTAQTFGSLTPLLVLRCFLLNGAAGLVFGRLYRRYGIQYAMLAHALFHIVSRTIWLIFLP